MNSELKIPQTKVSVIIVNYNAGKLLTKAVKSVIKFPGVEVIVVDNGIHDQSLQNLQPLQGQALKVINNKENLGFGKAVNQGVRQAQGEYIYLLNPDAELKRSALTRMVATAESHGNRAIIAPRLENPDGSPQKSCFRPQTITNALREYWLGVKGAYEKYLPQGKNPTRVHTAVAAAWMVPKKVWDELGGFDEKYFLYFEDLDLCDRAAKANIPVIYDPRAVITHAHGVSSRTNPDTLNLFRQSALTYHGRLKKTLIDLIILARNLFTPPVTSKKLLIILLTWTALVFAVAALGYFLLPSRFSPSTLVPQFYNTNFLLWSWANFDGAHYLSIAAHGYQTILGQSQYAFFPLFPLLIKLVSLTGLDLYTSAHLIVAASLIGFAFGLVSFAKQYLKNPLSLLLITLLSPGAVFLLSVYTEPLFLFLTVMTFLMADRQEWGRAALFAALATATRVNGLFLVLFLFIKLLKASKSPLFIVRYSLFSLAGFAAYMLYLYSRTGSALSWYTAQEGWGKSQATSPFVTIGNYTRALTTEFVPDLVHLTVAIEVVLTISLIYLLVRFWTRFKIDSAYKWYALGNLALPLATGSLGSMPRFSLILFPLFMVIPSLPRFPRLVHYSLFIILSITGIILFTRGYWYA